MLQGKLLQVEGIGTREKKQSLLFISVGICSLRCVESLSYSAAGKKLALKTTINQLLVFIQQWINKIVVPIQNFDPNKIP